MIIRVFDARGLEHLHLQRSFDGLAGTFGCIAVLRFTSTELREAFGITLAETDVETAFEAAAALARGAAPGSRLRNDRLARLLAERPNLLPCFVGHQQAPDGHVRPFLTDGPSGTWSLFFEDDGRLSLVEAGTAGLTLTGEERLLPTASPRAAGGFLLNRLQKARDAIARTRA